MDAGPEGICSQARKRWSGQSKSTSQPENDSGQEFWMKGRRLYPRRRSSGRGEESAVMTIENGGLCDALCHFVLLWISFLRPFESLSCTLTRRGLHLAVTKSDLTLS